MGSDIHSEVCVFGGGPGGATSALRLAQLGYAVSLVERAAFPRTHIGESLPPGILPVLDAIGLLNEIEQAGFLRPTRAIVRWSGKSDFIKSQSGEPGFLVDRGQFDQLLLKAARRAGVRVFQPATALRPRAQVGGGWRVTVCQERNKLTIQSRFLVDASGRRSILGGRKARKSPPLLALYGYWRSGSVADLNTYVEAGSNAWLWSAPLPDGTRNITVFTDPKSAGHLNTRDVESLYHNLLSDSVLLPKRIHDSLVSNVYACDASSYLDERPVSIQHIKVGDSALTVDPLASQGVQIAMATALMGSSVVNTVLSRPESSSIAVSFFKDRLSSKASRLEYMTAQKYKEHQTYADQPFWTSRSRMLTLENSTLPHQNTPLDPDSPIQLSELAVLEDTPVLDGDLIKMAPAIDHPCLDKPVAYLGQVELVPLLVSIIPGQTLRDTLDNWSRDMPLDLCASIVDWLWSKKILIRA